MNTEFVSTDLRGKEKGYSLYFIMNQISHFGVLAENFQILTPKISTTLLIFPEYYNLSF
jgi:hypothetical protein